MKLYYSPGACSMAPHIVLNELGLPYEAVPVDTHTHKLVKTGADYYAINPKGYVPAIELDDGSLLTEVAAILQYLADRKPEAGLLAAPGSMQRYRTIEWLTFISSELHKGFSPLWNPDMPEVAKGMFLDKLKTRFALLDAHLADNEFLMGKQFTVADAYAYTILNWSTFLKIDMSPWPQVQAYMKRVAVRVKVRETLHAEKLAA
ncbi:MAG TPA: glutathione transferase GstA [Gammaproteobacteria bacterium]|nr:glutathione transferase GstA [Gammaproteobacteria bacterium]